MTVLSIINTISIILTNIQGRDIDLSNMMLSIDFYESIFEKFLNGKLVIQDTLDLISNVPLVGNETLKIDIFPSQYEDEAVSLDFKIYKLDKDVFELSNGVKHKTLILYFCSSELFNDKLYTMSRYFNDTGANIVQWLLTNVMQSEKNLLSTDTDSNIEFHANFWNSSKIIDHICDISSSDFSDYIFYEDFSGFNFTPISELMNGSAVQEFVYEQDNAESMMRLNNIKSLKFDSYFDILSLLSSGFFGSIFYDSDEYSFLKTENILSDTENNLMSLGKYSFWDTNLSLKTNKIMPVYLDHSILNKKYTMMKMLQQYNLIVRMNGDFDRKCGNIVEFSFPNIDNENAFNDKFDGKWLIGSIRHKIDVSKNYEQNILLLKNASFNNEDFNLITTNRNI